MRARRLHWTSSYGRASHSKVTNRTHPKWRDGRLRGTFHSRRILAACCFALFSVHPIESQDFHMQSHRFGATARDVPVIGQGTWNIELADTSQAIATLRRGIDLGLTHIDTAEMYGSGRS